MTKSGTDNLSAYLRIMAMEGTFLTADDEKISKQEKTQKSWLPYCDFYEEQCHRCAANFSGIVKGFGMLPNKFLHERIPPCIVCQLHLWGSRANWILQKSQSEHTSAVLAIRLSRDVVLPAATFRHSLFIVCFCIQNTKKELAISPSSA